MRGKVPIWIAIYEMSINLPFLSSNKATPLIVISVECEMFAMISLRSILAALALFGQYASAQKYLFAHVVVGNAAAHTQSAWEGNIILTKNAGLDSSALNCGCPESNILTQVANAFAAAEALGSNFKLFSLFDYLGDGKPLPATGSNSLVSYLNQYVSKASYFLYKGVPFGSTFERTVNIANWAQGGIILSAVGNLYFLLD
jgi:hypothetical protein